MAYGRRVQLQRPQQQSTAYEINTFLITPSSHSTTPSPTFVGSLTQPLLVPNFSFNTLNLSRPKTLPFGSTTGSSSIALFV